MHEVVSAVEYWPAVHPWQPRELSAAPYAPVAAEMVPAAQFVQVVDESLSSSTCPAPHWVQRLAPVLPRVSVIDPAAQSMHELWP